MVNVSLEGTDQSPYPWLWRMVEHGCVNKFVPESAQLLQFRHWGSVGFNMKGLVVVQNFLYLGQSLERHRLALKKKKKPSERQHSTQDNNLHCLS